MEPKTEFSGTDTSNGCIWRKPPHHIKEVKLLNIKLCGSENYLALRENYSRILNILMIKYLKKKNQKQCNIFTHLQRSSSIPCILPEFMSFITSELKTIVMLKPAIILRALYCLLKNIHVFVEKNVAFNTCILSSLKKFLANSLKCCDLGYLLKDVAADILCELENIFLSDTSRKLLLYNFHYLQEAYEDLYSATIAWLLSMTPELGSKLVHSEALYSRIFLVRALNFPKLYARLVAVCKGHVYCCLPSQIVDVSVKDTHSLYNLKLVNQLFYNLMRHEAIYTPIFYARCEPRISKPVQFSYLLFEVNLSELLESSSCKRHERDMPDFSCRPPPRKKLRKSPKNFYASQTSSSNKGNDSFINYWVVLYCTRASADSQLVFFGYLSPFLNRIIDICSWEKASKCRISAPPSHSNPFHMKLQEDQYRYNPFMI